jgi:hypothetical protein
MKKVVLTTLAWALLSVAFLIADPVAASNEDDVFPEIETTDRTFRAWEEGYEFTEYAPIPPVPFPYYPYPVIPVRPIRVVPLPRDVRVLIAERERLKVDYNYYLLSPYPGSRERAQWFAEKLREVEEKIEAWRFGYR